VLSLLQDRDNPFSKEWESLDSLGIQAVEKSLDFLFQLLSSRKRRFGCSYLWRSLLIWHNLDNLRKEDQHQQDQDDRQMEGQAAANRFHQTNHHIHILCRN